LHDQRKYSELQEVTHLHTDIVRFLDIVLWKLRNYSNSFKRVSEERGEKVEKVFVDLTQVFLEIHVEFLLVRRQNFAEILFY
jgi:hypothetical protein